MSKPVTRSWVNCPVCGEPDMEQTEDEEQNRLIFCVNHNCLSNGGDNREAMPEASPAVPPVVPANVTHNHTHYEVHGAEKATERLADLAESLANKAMVLICFGLIGGVFALIFLMVVGDPSLIDAIAQRLIDSGK